MADIEGTKEIVRRFLQAVENGDEAAVDALQAPDCTWWILGHGDMSRAEYNRIVKSMLLSADRRRAEIIGCVAEGDRIAVEIVSEIRYGDRIYRNFYHHLFVIRDGVIVHGREYFDTQAVAAFLADGAP